MSAVSVSRVRLAQAVRAESTKLRSLRTPVATMAGTAAGVVLLSWAITVMTTRAYATGHPQDAAGLEPGSAFLVVLHHGQIGAILLGAWLLVEENVDRAVRSAFLAVPRRSTLYAAKVLVAAVAAAVTAAVGALGSAAVRCLATDCSAPDGRFAATSTAQVRVLAGVVVCWTLLAVLTFGLAALVRNGLVSLGVVLALVLAMSPYLLTVTPLARYLPDQAGAQLTQPGPFLAGDLGPALGLAVLAAWTVALTVAGGVSFRRWPV